MQVAVIGTGSVGAALLFPLTYNPQIDSVLVLNRGLDSATAAIMDVASANPAGAAKLKHVLEGDVSQSDVIVITAGVPPRGRTEADIYDLNLQICRDVFNTAPPKESAIVICVSSPVDYLPVHVQIETGLPRAQVFGFGGDLDSNRLRYVLNSRKIENHEAHAIGEHGAEAIAAYEGEQDYSEVTDDLASFWKRITGEGVRRNFATADLLAKLVNSIVCDGKAIHNVCAYHPAHDIYITWPFIVGRTGVERPIPLNLSAGVENSLSTLVATRKAKLADRLVR